MKTQTDNKRERERQKGEMNIKRKGWERNERQERCQWESIQKIQKREHKREREKHKNAPRL